MKFSSILEKSGGNATGIVVPQKIVEALGGGKKPKVNVVLNGFTYRSSIAMMGGDYMIPVSKDVREKAGVKGGDPIDVEVTLDTAPREVEVPADFGAALDLVPAARAKFDTLSNSNKSRHVLSVDGAKTPETRARRIEKAIAELSA